VRGKAQLWHAHQAGQDLFTSVVAFGLAALAAVLGVMHFLIGWSLRGLGRAAAPATTEEPT
jgi:hypothetical protein